MLGFSVLLLALCVPAAWGATGSVNQPCAARNAMADIVFLIDTSATMTENGVTPVQNFLYRLVNDFTIGSGKDQTRFAFLAYSQDATIGITLTDGSNLAALNATIAKLKYDGYALREITKALSLEEQKITDLRASAKKLLVSIIFDTFTGTEPTANGLLDTVRHKYDALLSIAVGENAIKFAYDDVLTFSGLLTDTFFASDFDELDFAKLFVERNACPMFHASTPYVPTTPAVTQPSGVDCTLSTLKYDIYLFIDVSSVMSASDFSALKQAIIALVQQYNVQNGNTQFAIIGVSTDAQRYFTAFHAGQNVNSLLVSLNLLAQENNKGQAFDLALRVADNALFASYANDGNTQLAIYLTANTNFDKDPSAEVSALKSKYGLHFLAVRFGSGADAGKLTQIGGNAACVIDATSAGARSSLAKTVEEFTCKKAFC